jgi:hypothetical protein
MKRSDIKIETRQAPAKRELAFAKKLSPEQKTEVRKKMRREYGVGTFLDYMTELTKAARKIQHEEQLMLNFGPKGRPVN